MKIPLEITKIKDPDGLERVRLTIAFQDAIQNTSLNIKIIHLQEKYIYTIKKCKEMIDYMRESRKNAGDPILKWHLSNEIYNFLLETEQNNIIITNFRKSLSRDIGLSLRLINSLIAFRESYSEIKMVNKKINWDRYREILDISDNHLRQLMFEKILNGEIRTRTDIKNFKKFYINQDLSRRA